MLLPTITRPALFNSATLYLYYIYTHLYLCKNLLQFERDKWYFCDDRREKLDRQYSYW